MKVTIDEEMRADGKQPLTYTPKTAFGEKLLALRKKIIDGGAPLLSWDEIEKEVSVRRGGYESNSL